MENRDLTQAAGHTAQLRRDGKNAAEIKDSLVKAGYVQDTAAQVIAMQRDETETANRSHGTNTAMYGFTWIVVALLSAFSFYKTESNPFWYGTTAILLAFGGWKIVSGLAKRNQRW